MSVFKETFPPAPEDSWLEKGKGNTDSQPSLWLTGPLRRPC